MRGLKIPIALGVFVAVVLIGVAARSVYYKNQVLDPMTHQASEISGVEGVRVSEAFDGRKDVYVQFGPNAPIEEAFPKVAGLARATFGASLGRVIPEDRRSTELEQVYHDIHFHVHEGISTGKFTQMASDVARELADRILAMGGVDRLLVQSDQGGLPFEEVAASMARFAEDVRPRLASLLAGGELTRLGG